MEKRERLFWMNVNKNGPTMPHMKTKCWVWTGATVKGGGLKNRNSKRVGYGVLYFPEMEEGKPQQYAHRAAWFFRHGPIPKGKKILHRCDNTLCIRHVYKGTTRDNARDAAIRGLLKGEKNGNSKLTGQDIKEVFRLRLEGWTQQKIGDKLGVSQVQISHILLGRQRRGEF